MPTCSRENCRRDYPPRSAKYAIKVTGKPSPEFVHPKAYLPRRPYLPALILVILTLTSEFGCRNQTRSNAPTVTDDTGRIIVGFSPPARTVVTLAPSLTEIVMAAGAGDRLIGVSSADRLPETDSLAKINALPVDFEAVVSLNPDLVLLLDGVNRTEDAERLQELGIAAYVLRSDSLSDIFADIRMVGQLLGTSAPAARHSHLLEEATASIERRTRAAKGRPRVLFLVGDEQLYTFGEGGYVHDLISKAGGQSITATIPQHNAVVSEEYVLTENPDVIIGSFGTDYDASHLVELHPSWSQLEAIINHRVYSLDPDVILLPGPRLVNALTVLAGDLHPGVFRQDSSGVVVFQ